jgi:hypothetical protein
LPGSIISCSVSRGRDGNGTRSSTVQPQSGGMAADRHSPKPRLNRCRLHSPNPDAGFVGSLIVAGGSLDYSFHTHGRCKDRCADELTFVRNQATVIQLTIIISSRCREAACGQLLTTIRMITIILIWNTLGSPDSGKMDHRQCLRCRERHFQLR